MKSPRRSKMSYTAATSLFFVLAATVIALAGLLPSKSSIAASPAKATATAADAQAKTKDSTTLRKEEWLRIAKAL